MRRRLWTHCPVAMRDDCFVTGMARRFAVVMVAYYVDIQLCACDILRTKKNDYAHNNYVVRTTYI